LTHAFHTMNRNTKLGIFGGFVVVGLLVIFQPSLFYFSEVENKANPRHKTITALTEQFRQQSFDENIQQVTKQATRSHNRLAELRRQQPWTGETPPRLAMEIRTQEEALYASNAHLNALVTGRDELMTQIRALTPVFSKMAWEETRDLFYKRQEEYAGASYRWWKMDMMFDMIFGGMTREDNVISYALTALVRLVTQLSFGTIIGMIDFTFRLPFWLKEYQLYTPDDFRSEYALEGAQETAKTKRRGAEDDSHTGNEGGPESGSESSSGYEHGSDTTGSGFDDADIGGVRAINSGGGWKSTLSAVLFWV